MGKIMMLENLIKVWRKSNCQQQDPMRQNNLTGENEDLELHKEIKDNFESMELKIEISKLLYREHYDIVSLKLERLREMINCRKGANYQYVIYTKAIIDYSLGRINQQEYLAELYYAIHISKPAYKPERRLKGILTRQETLIIINIALYYRRTRQKEMALKILSQLASYYRKNSINFEQNAAALVWINMSELLEEMGEYKIGAKIAEEGINLESKYTQGTFLNRLQASVQNNIKYLEKDISMQDNETVCLRHLYEIL